jgi:hypothetical protein
LGVISWLEHLECKHRPASAAGGCLCGARSSLGRLVGQTATGLGGGGVIVVPVVGLHEVHELLSVQALESFVEETKGTDHSGRDQQDHEENKEREVQDSVADNTTLAKFGLLERVDRRANLATVDVVSEELEVSLLDQTYLGRSQKSMTEWNLSM